MNCLIITKPNYKYRLGFFYCQEFCIKVIVRSFFVLLGRVGWVEGLFLLFGSQNPKAVVISCTYKFADDFTCISIGNHMVSSSMFA